MKHYLNVCDVNGAEVEPVDVITFGSPCQDLSVAGKRKGLKHEDNGDDETTRSGLFMEAVRIIKEMREADGLDRLRSGRTDGYIRPRFAVWENVPGAFSSNKGDDFRVVLEELARVKDREVSIPLPKDGKWKTAGEIIGDGWSIAWRVLDAQFHGVPQRRRRIFLVADFAEECAGEILFECKGLPGYPSESGEQRKEAAGNSENSIGTTVPYILQIRSGCDGGGKGALVQTDKSACLTAAQTQTLFQPVTYNGVSVTNPTNAQNPKAGDPCHTLTEDSRNYVVQPVSYSINHQGGNVEQILKEQTGTLTASMNTSGNNKLSVCCEDNPVCITAHGFGQYEQMDAVGTLLCGQNDTIRSDTPLVIETFTKTSFGQYDEGIGTLKASGGDLGGGQ